MDAILLAGGYATRLYPLTKDRPKALLPLDGRPILHYVTDPLDACGAIERMYLVTNAKFAAHFERWAASRTAGKPVTILNDGTESNETRLGAIGDIRFVFEHADINLARGVYVLGTDNVADFDITEIVGLALAKRGTTVFASRIADEARLKRMGIAQVDEQGRVTDFEEKPTNPKSNLAVPPFYVYSPEAVMLLPRYLKEGNNPDAPGHFIAWLIRHSPVFACVTDRCVRDIGTTESYVS